MTVDFSLTAPTAARANGRDANVLPAIVGRDYAQVTLTCWLSAQLSAFDISDVEAELDEVNYRLRNGDAWLREHGPSNPRYAEAVQLRQRLDHTQRALMLQLRCACYACWTHCCETYAAAAHVNHDQWLEEHAPGRLLSLDHPAFVWRSLRGRQQPPGAWPPQDEELWVERRMSWVPVWDQEELQILLQRRGTA